MTISRGRKTNGHTQGKRMEQGQPFNGGENAKLSNYNGAAAAVAWARTSE